jgi:hypothetical protein
MTLTECAKRGLEQLVGCGAHRKRSPVWRPKGRVRLQCPYLEEEESSV